MKTQMTFERYELKYLLTHQQKEEILLAMEPYMALDEYGRTTIRNIYFDTESFRLIRRSLEKPAYKEKLRVRSYEKSGPESPIFVELKKKYDSVVYKRRMVLPREHAMAWLDGKESFSVQSQIASEIDYFCQFYQGLRPRVFLTYEREAFFEQAGGDFRVTFDENILYRQDDLCLGADIYGTPLLSSNQTLMEVKTSGGLPLWMVHALSKQGIFKTSFSKYGAAYQTMMRCDFRGGLHYA